MPETLPYAWSAGDPVPRFASRIPGKAKFQFDSAAGRYLVLSFFCSSAIENSRVALAHMMARRDFFDDKTAAFFGVSIDARDETEKRLGQSTGIRFFWDFEKELSRLYGVIGVTDGLTGGVTGGEPKYHPLTLVIDPMLRVIAAIPMDDAREHNRIFDAVIAQLPPVERHGATVIHAPVLILPRVLEPALCETLIGLFEKDGGYESGFMREVDGKTVGILDDRFKRRRDFDFDVKPEFEALRALLRERISRKLVPEIFRVFQFQVTRMERYIVSRYDSETGGFFRPHRDNTTPGTAHRRFACTINLNAEDYEGGDLRFPEFGQEGHRAPTGGAVIFSCSLLHEALPVTKGRRYAFLPFFYDEEAARLREKNQHSLTGQTIDQNRGDRNKGEDGNGLQKTL
jgi:peroxiredoxin